MVEIIAEIANSHEGSVDNAKKLALKSFESGADAVKFQIYFAEELLVKNHPRYNHFKNQSFSQKEWVNLIKSVKKKGKVYCDVFGIRAFQLAKSLKVDGYKIHSSDLINHYLLEKVSKEKKKIFFSTGGSKILEINYALKYFKNKIKPILLHGFQSYPTTIEDSKLLRIKHLKKIFGNFCEIGYQDHTSGDDPFNLYLPLIAIGMGATFIEKHVTLNRKKKGIDYYSSLEPKDFKKFVQIIKKSYKALSKNFNNFSESEKKYRLTVKKHWVANKKINKNSKLIKNIEMKRVNLINSEPLLFEKINGCKVSKDIIEDEPISLKNIKKKNIGLIVVRSNSKRLKKKAFLNINRKNIIDHLIKRIKKSRQIDGIILCTTKNKDDKKLIKIAKNNNIGYFAGSDRDVLKRMLDSLKQFKNIGSVIRITGDDILVDPTYLDKAISKHLSFNADYTSSKELPPGTETEVFSYETLKFIFKNAIDTNGTEYLTNYIVDNDQFFFSIKNDIQKRHKIDARLTIDTKKDFILVKKLLEYMKKINKEYDYTLDDIKLFFSKYPKLKKINNSTKQRNMPLEYNSKLILKNI